MAPFPPSPPLTSAPISASPPSTIPEPHSCMFWSSNSTLNLATSEPSSRGIPRCYSRYSSSLTCFSSSTRVLDFLATWFFGIGFFRIFENFTCVGVGVSVQVSVRSNVGEADAVRFVFSKMGSSLESLPSVTMDREMSHYSGVFLFKGSVMCLVMASAISPSPSPTILATRSTPQRSSSMTELSRESVIPHLTHYLLQNTKKYFSPYPWEFPYCWWQGEISTVLLSL